MIQTPEALFEEYLGFFTPLDLPFSLLPDLEQIPSDPEPLPGTLQEAFILPFEGDEVDEYTEYIPFGRIAGTKEYHALIYWKAGVLRYEYILATYSTGGTPLSHAIVGGLRYEEEGTLHSVGVVHEDLTITIAEGLARTEEAGLNPDQTQTYLMVITPAGMITYDIHEENKET